jgi:hypothetical protein
MAVARCIRLEAAARGIASATMRPAPIGAKSGPAGFVQRLGKKDVITDGGRQILTAVDDYLAAYGADLSGPELARAWAATVEEAALARAADRECATGPAFVIGLKEAKREWKPSRAVVVSDLGLADGTSITRGGGAVKVDDCCRVWNDGGECPPGCKKKHLCNFRRGKKGFACGGRHRRREGHPPKETRTPEVKVDASGGAPAASTTAGAGGNGRGLADAGQQQSQRQVRLNLLASGRRI